MPSLSFSASTFAPSRAVCGAGMMNSSPPQRKMLSGSRSWARVTLAVSASTASPVSWPQVSFTRLKWSGSNMMRESSS